MKLADAICKIYHNDARWESIDVRLVALICHWAENQVMLLYSMGLSVDDSFEVTWAMVNALIRELNQNTISDILKNARARVDEDGEMDKHRPTLKDIFDK